jgi:DNA-binding transcriptional LysR family regulator
MLDLLYLRTFVVVAGTKSFNKAAAELGYSQSSVTHHIKMLEKELGARLFDRFRFSRGAKLTEVGKRLFDDANRILQLAEQVRGNIAQKK